MSKIHSSIGLFCIPAVYLCQPGPGRHLRAESRSVSYIRTPRYHRRHPVHRRGYRSCIGWNHRLYREQKNKARALNLIIQKFNLFYLVGSVRFELTIDGSLRHAREHDIYVSAPTGHHPKCQETHCSSFAKTAGARRHAGLGHDPSKGAS